MLGLPALGNPEAGLGTRSAGGQRKKWRAGALRLMGAAGLGGEDAVQGYGHSQSMGTEKPEIKRQGLGCRLRGGKGSARMPRSLP